MTNIISIAQRREKSSKKIPYSGETAEILFFTGIRQENICLQQDAKTKPSGSRTKTRKKH